jgi:DNA polymerase III delta subunit
MLYFFSGTDREKTRKALDTAVKRVVGKGRVTRITDANSPEDLKAALQGAGMFGESRVVVLDGVLVNEEMRTHVINSLAVLKASAEVVFILEEKLDADTRKKIEKYAEKSERLDAAGKKRSGDIFIMANALSKRDKRALWLQYQGELAKGTAPEAIHGVLFWGAKEMLLKSRTEEVRTRAQKLVAMLAELPHESRRRGEELEYALERFVLSGA